MLPSEGHFQSFIAAYKELTTDSDKEAWIYLGPDVSEDIIYNRFPEYVDELHSRETVPPAHFVRNKTYWAIRNGEVVGRIGLRLELNDFLARIGGHIGYIVRPSARRQGVASAMMAFVLSTPEAKAIGKLLVTCDAGNEPSERVILKNGGIYESTVYPEGASVGKNRYWIILREA